MTRENADLNLALSNIKRGAELLDQEQPGWRRKLELEELDLGDVKACVLGQIYGDYTTGADCLFGPVVRPWYDEERQDKHHLAQKHGFESTSEYSYSELTKAWKYFLGRLNLGGGTA